MTEMPPKLAEIVDEFASAPRDVVLEMLLEFSDAVPDLPAELATHEGMEQVPECQTQFFLKATVQPDRTVADVLASSSPDNSPAPGERVSSVLPANR